MKSVEVEIKVGIFVSIGLGLIMLTILLLGGGQGFFERNAEYYSRFPQIEGLVEGAVVKMAGIKVGQVNVIKFLPDTNQVEVHFSVAKKFKDAIRQDSLVGFQTQGMLGDRYLVVSAGATSAPSLPEGSEIKGELPRDLKDYLSNADEVLDKLKNSLRHMDGILGSFQRDSRAENFFRNMSSFSTNVNEGTKGVKDSMNHFNSILSKIDNGQGTLGSLVNDPALYDDLRALLGGANRNRVLKYFIKKSVEESREAQQKQK